MAKRKNKLHIKPRYINLAIQNVHIQRRFPGFSSHLSNGRAIWRGCLQPRHVSPVYKIEVSYRLKKLPRVWVLSPPVSEGAEHLHGDGSLCLYWHKEWEWQPDRLIAETIIPWAASWLYFYELWLDTGKWLGPSSHDYLQK